MPPATSRVFISYSHDSAEHMNAVLALANRLRKEGVDCWIDQYERSPREGWPRWCENQIEEARFVLVACTETYLRRFRGKEEPGKGKGVTFEGFIVTQELYDSQGKNEKFIPIVFAAGEREHIPILLRGASNYDVSTSDGYDELYWGILGQSRVTPPDLGPIRNRSRAAAPPPPLPKLELESDYYPCFISYSTKNQKFVDLLYSQLRSKGVRVWLATEELKIGDKIRVEIDEAIQRHDKMLLVLSKDSVESRWVESEVEAAFEKERKQKRTVLFPIRLDDAVMDAAQAWAKEIRNTRHIGDFREWKDHNAYRQAVVRLMRALEPEVKPRKLEPQRGVTTRPSNVPLAPSSFFTGRESILEDLRNKLRSFNRVALCGVRGVGKTQLAAEYAHRHRNDYQAVLWARAESRDTLIADFASIARLLNLPEKDEKDQSVIVSAVKRWFQANSGWLFVLDNADDLALAQEFLPSIRSGHLLLTTTVQAIGKVAEKVLIEKMADDEAALLLLRRATVIGKHATLDEAAPADRKLARELARELGGLPLALDQAGAFIEETTSTLAEYGKLYQKEGKQLRKERGEVRSEHPSVTVTFSLAFAELAKRDPTAADLVRICAFLAPDAIPEELFTKGASALGEEFARRAENPLDFAETLKQAAKFSMIQRDAPDRSLDIHPFVQEVLKDEINSNQLREWAERAVRAVNLAFPDPEFRNWPDCERLLPHAKACAALIEEFSFEFEEAALLLNEAAFYMKERAQYREAEPLFRRSLAIRERVLGPEHLDVANSLDNLALLYRYQGRYGEAEPLYQRSLAIREKSLGPEHPGVASSLNNLALLYENQGRYAEAVPLYQRSLAIREKALGPEHPAVAKSLNNLAALYHDQGRYAEAMPLYQRSLAIREKALGSEHPEVASSLNSLAALYYDQGRYAEAEPLYRRSLTIREKMLGPEHPGFANSLANLALLDYAQGRFPEAEPLYQRSLAIREKSLGPEHPEVATSLNNLAGLYKAQGRHAEAEPLYQRAMTIYEKVLGPNHPNVATVLENYADLLRKTGRDTEARPLESRAEAIREKTKQK